jgi:hypothetical protein
LRIDEGNPDTITIKVSIYVSVNQMIPPRKITKKMKKFHQYFLAEEVEDDEEIF